MINWGTYAMTMNHIRIFAVVMFGFGVPLPSSFASDLNPLIKCSSPIKVSSGSDPRLFSTDVQKFLSVTEQNGQLSIIDLENGKKVRTLGPYPTRNHSLEVNRNRDSGLTFAYIKSGVNDSIMLGGSGLDKNFDIRDKILTLFQTKPGDQNRILGLAFQGEDSDLRLSWTTNDGFAYSCEIDLETQTKGCFAKEIKPLNLGLRASSGVHRIQVKQDENSFVRDVVTTQGLTGAQIAYRDSSDPENSKLFFNDETFKNSDLTLIDVSDDQMIVRAVSDQGRSTVFLSASTHEPSKVRKLIELEQNQYLFSGRINRQVGDKEVTYFLFESPRIRKSDDSVVAQGLWMQAIDGGSPKQILSSEKSLTGRHDIEEDRIAIETIDGVYLLRNCKF